MKLGFLLFFFFFTGKTEDFETPCGSPKQKNSSRRNKWGNLSYADLITQAIKSSPEQRLTLSQIYDWVVTNVPYFNDKGDSASSSGWKVQSWEILSVIFVLFAKKTMFGFARISLF